ncbi:hypothetical protein [Methylocystis sp. S23]
MSHEQLSLPRWPAASAALETSDARLLSALLLAVILPLAIFAARLEPAPAVALLGASGLLAFLFSTGFAPGALLSAKVDWRLYGGCLFGALALCLASGEAHFFFSPYDWLIRDAVLADVTLNKYPVFYHYQGDDFVLRAPLGMYMAPALIGWSQGLRAAHYALLAQNAFLLGTILYFSARLAGGPALRFLALLMLFSPVDIVPRLVQNYMESLQSGEFLLQPHLMFWNRLVFFWGQIPSFFWAPNHALAAWIFAILLLLEIRREIDIAYLGLAFLVLLFWSPLAMIGAAPFLAWRLARHLSRDLAKRRNALALAAALLLIPLAFFLSLDAGRVTREWLFLREDFWFWYGLLLVFGLPQAWILIARWPEVAEWRRGAVGLAIALLIAMPFYRIGVTVYDNDMTMRCALTPWFVLAFGFCGMIQSRLDRGAALGVATVGVVLLSAFTGFFEIRRGLSDATYAINDCNLLTVSDKAMPGFSIANYLARMETAPAWLVKDSGVRLRIENRVCWPGYALTAGQ